MSSLKQQFSLVLQKSGRDGIKLIVLSFGAQASSTYCFACLASSDIFDIYLPEVETSKARHVR